MAEALRRARSPAVAGWEDVRGCVGPRVKGRDARGLHYASARSTTAYDGRHHHRRARRALHRHRRRPHGSGSRRGGLPRRAEVRPADRRCRSTTTASSTRAAVRSRGCTSTRRTPSIVEWLERARARCVAAGKIDAQLPALLALQAAGHLPRHRAVVRLDGRDRTCASTRCARSTRSSGSPAGRSTASRRWSPTVPTGASAASARGACRSRCSSARRAARPSRPTRPSTRSSALFATEGADAWFTKAPSRVPAGGHALPALRLRASSSPRPTSSTCGSSRASRTRACSRRGPSCTARPRLYLEGTDQHRGWFQSAPADERRRVRRRAVRARAHARLHRRRRRSQDVQVARQRDLAARRHREVRRRHRPPVGGLGRLRPGRHRLRRDPRPHERGVPPHPQHVPVPALATSTTSTRRDAVPWADMPELDRFALVRLADLARARHRRTTTSGASIMSSARSTTTCVTDLSAVYLDVLKDRLYADARELGRRAAARRRCSRAILGALVRMLAPILTFTCEEVWQFMPEATARCRERPALRLAATDRSRPRCRGTRTALRAPCLPCATR